MNPSYSEILLLKNFVSHVRGAAAIEFLFALPICLIIFAILHDVGRMIQMKAHVTRAASNIADILSQTIEKDELAVPWISGGIASYGGPNGQNYLLMGQILVFPDKRPNPVYTFYDTTAPIGVEVRSSGTDGVTMCLHSRRGRLIPEAQMGWTTTGRLEPEIVVGVAVGFRLPLLSGPFGTGATPTITINAVERRFMRSISMAPTAGTVVTRPLYLAGTANSGQTNNPLCNPAD